MFYICTFDTAVNIPAELDNFVNKSNCFKISDEKLIVHERDIGRKIGDTPFRTSFPGVSGSPLACTIDPLLSSPNIYSAEATSWMDARLENL